MPTRLAITLAVALLVPAATAFAQGEGSGQGGKRSLLPREHEISLARSAAPKEVSAAATIYVLTDTGYAVAVQGSNGNHCLVNRSWPESIEPHCFDEEAAATVMAMDLRRGAMRQRGAEKSAIDAHIESEVKRGQFRYPTRPAMTYMMSSAQVLYDDGGRRVGAWEPHLMIFYPNLTSAQLGLGATPNPQAAIVVDSGKPGANIMIIVKKAVDPVAPGGT
jgi:hypothetical protein